MTTLYIYFAKTGIEHHCSQLLTAGGNLILAQIAMNLVTSKVMLPVKYVERRHCKNFMLSRITILLLA